MTSARELNSNALAMARLEIERAESLDADAQTVVEAALYAWSSLDDAARAVARLDRYLPRTEYEIAGRIGVEQELRGRVRAALISLTEVDEL